LLEVRREPRAHRVVAGEGQRALAGGAHERHARADDAVRDEEVLGIELADVLVGDEPVAGVGQRGYDEAQLAPQVAPRGRGAQSRGAHSLASVNRGLTSTSSTRLAKPCSLSEVIVDWSFASASSS